MDKKTKKKSGGANLCMSWETKNKKEEALHFGGLDSIETAFSTFLDPSMRCALKRKDEARKIEYKREWVRRFPSFLTSPLFPPFSSHPHIKPHTSQWPPSKVTTTALSHPFLTQLDTSVRLCQRAHAHTRSLFTLSLTLTIVLSRCYFSHVDRKILLLGSGFVAEPCVEYLCRRPENKLTIGNVPFHSSWREVTRE